MKLSPRRVVLASAALATALGALAVSQGSSTTLADDYYCVVVYDAQGRPVNTTCVPWPFG